MAFSFLTELEFSLPPSALSNLLLYLVPLFSQEVAGLAPALPQTSQVTMHMSSSWVLSVLRGERELR